MCHLKRSLTNEVRWAAMPGQVTPTFMKPSTHCLVAIAGVLCGCVATTPQEHSVAKATVEASPEKALLPPPSMPQSIWDTVDAAPATTASFPWERTVIHVIVVPPPPPRIVSELAASPYPKAGFRPEHLIDTRHSLSADLDSVDK